jgi:hypothetical protein
MMSYDPCAAHFYSNLGLTDMRFPYWYIRKPPLVYYASGSFPNWNTGQLMTAANFWEVYIRMQLTGSLKRKEQKRNKKEVTT